MFVYEFNIPFEGQLFCFLFLNVLLSFLFYTFMPMFIQLNRLKRVPAPTVYPDASNSNSTLSSPNNITPKENDRFFFTFKQRWAKLTGKQNLGSLYLPTHWFHLFPPQFHSLKPSCLHFTLTPKSSVHWSSPNTGFRCSPFQRELHQIRLRRKKS